MKTEVNKPVATDVSAVVSASRNKVGLTLATLSIPVGIVAWGLLWKMGFMASFVSFGIAWLAVFLYALGANSEPQTRTAKLALIGIIVAGVLLSFYGGVVLDAQEYVSKETGWGFWKVLGTGDFWVMVKDMVLSSEFWKEYGMNAGIAVVFGALGSANIIRSLAATQKPGETIEPAASLKTPAKSKSKDNLNDWAKL